MECADGGVAEGSHDLWSGAGAGADWGSVFVVGDVAYPVGLVLDRSVAAGPAGELCRFGPVYLQVGDGVDGLGGEAFRLVEAVSAAADLQGLGGVREIDPGGDCPDFAGADLAVAVSAVGVACGVGDGPPGWGGELGVQVELVGLDSHDPAGAVGPWVLGLVASDPLHA